jgi:hypothetical protein
MDKSVQVMVHFKPEAAQVLPAEVDLLESILSELVLSMKELAAALETEPDTELCK